MLKFIKHHMTSIDGIEMYPIVSFLIFFTFFILLFMYVMKIQKSTVTELAQLPLNDEPVEPTQNNRHETNQ